MLEVDYTGTADIIDNIDLFAKANMNISPASNDAGLFELGFYKNAAFTSAR